MRRTLVTNQFYLDLISTFSYLKWQIVAAGLYNDLGSMQALTLIKLNELTPHSMKDLCSILHCDASNVTGIIDGLEQKGLIERRNDPKDRRIKTLHILPAGQKLQQKILEQLVHESTTILAPLTDDEILQLTSIMSKLNSSPRT